MTTPPRGRGPVTAPPPDSIRSRIKDFLDWKSAVFGLILLGSGGTMVWTGIATKSDLARDRAAAEFQAFDLAKRIDTNQRRLDTLDEGNRWRDAALKAIADRVGAFVPPPPAVIATPVP